MDDASTGCTRRSSSTSPSQPRAARRARGRRCAEILAFTTNLEHIGDIIDKNLMELADKKIRLQLRFSREGGLREAVHGEACGQPAARAQRLRLGRRRDRAQAHRREGRGARRRARRGREPPARLRDGRPESIDSSALHLDILRDLKRINSHISAVAYPILDEAGELYRSRLKRVERRALQEEESDRPTAAPAAPAAAPPVTDAPRASDSPPERPEPAVAVANVTEAPPVRRTRAR